MLKRYSAAPYLFWAGLFIIVPILLIVYYSVTIESPQGIQFSLENFRRFFDPLFLKVTLRSLWIALQSTVLCLLIGYPLAYLMTRVSHKAERLLVILLVLPMWMNFLLRTYAWQTILMRNGVLNTLLEKLGLPGQDLMFTKTAVLLVMVYNFLPFMVLPIYTVIKKIDGKVIEAAEDLGANRKTVFQKVIIPLSLPGIISGITMTFLPAVSTFVIPSLIGGGKYTMIGNLIEQQFLLLTNWHFGSALSMILLVMILISIAIMNRFEHEEEGGNLW